MPPLLLRHTRGGHAAAERFRDDSTGLRQLPRGMAALTKAAAWPPHSKPSEHKHL